jgi:hypothetical protein
MKTLYEYINFELIQDTGKTTIWSCTSNSGSDLGNVRWYAPWRQYCFLPIGGAVFSTGCLNDIIDFIKQLTEERDVKNN